MRIFVIACEPSGDILGANLMRALQAAHTGSVRFAGIGGAEMEAAGLDSLCAMNELAVMGLVEVVRHIPRLRRQIAATVDAIVAARPDMIVTIDAPGFTRRVIERLPGRMSPRVHYVAPTVWAWKPQRAQHYARLYDKLLTLYPFEPALFHAAGLDAVFVGHPAADAHGPLAQAQGAAARADLGIAADVPVLGILAGSRDGELRRMLPVYRTMTALLAAGRSPLAAAQILMPTLAHLAPLVRTETRGWRLPVQVVTPTAAHRFAAFKACNVAIATSGTVALELAACGVPAAIAYKVHPLSSLFFAMTAKLRYAHILNMMQDQPIVPERLQGGCTAARLAADAVALLRDGPAQLAALQPALAALRAPGGSAAASAASRILAMLRA